MGRSRRVHAAVGRATGGVVRRARLAAGLRPAEKAAAWPAESRLDCLRCSALTHPHKVETAIKQPAKFAPATRRAAKLQQQATAEIEPQSTYRPHFSGRSLPPHSVPCKPLEGDPEPPQEQLKIVLPDCGLTCDGDPVGRVRARQSLGKQARGPVLFEAAQQTKHLT